MEELHNLPYGNRLNFLRTRGKNRYAFHHEEPDLHDRRFDGYQISVVDERTTERVKYTLPGDGWSVKAELFPLRELMYTFVEQINVRLCQLEFRFGEKVLTLNSTPQSLGMTATGENVISVRAVTSSYDERVGCFTRLNRMGKVSVGVGPHQGDVFGTDLLPRILEYAGLETLAAACQVCRHWFHVAQRFSVLVQLQDGDADSWQHNQKYPLLLHDGCRHSFNVALCQASEASGTNANEIRWNSTTMLKEKTVSFGYCKAAGCRVLKTVEMQSITRDLESKWEALNNAKTAFMRYVESAQAATEGDQKKHAHKATGQTQDFPPEGEAGNGFIAEARDWRYKNCAVELYRRYFSPDMFFIFPLIVNSEAAFGLDFSSCVTSLIFGELSDDEAQPRANRMQRLMNRANPVRRPLTADGLPRPLGSVSWRIHDATEVAAVGTGFGPGAMDSMDAAPLDAAPLVMMNGSKPQIILEVLFIAVWEGDRGGEYGSSLVASLESKVTQYAKSQGLRSALMYVEVGYEQPKAKVFWGNNGFSPVVDKAQGIHTQDDLLTGRMVALEDWQLGFIDRRCLRFKDTVQYAKTVLVE
ncbi:expressed unknown protein [Seminavis robusta]|uniref:F-box domain-containing protein n=1 Tax=Seminavis robusta TaxID=568900 RepID=A0A9N8DZI7_9STRA|nr:expressed unknown protein [Seminavis robusta]|eukprot:Sro502_g155680.1 n/a (585) ;mRNA; f:59898-61652